MSRYSAAARDRAVLLAGLAWAIVMVVLLTAATSGCGGAQQVGAGATCGTMMQLIATRADYSAERATADLDSQRAICERLTAEVTP